MTVSAAQFRAARALLGWSQSELARRSRVAYNTVGGLETGRRDPGERTLDAVIGTLESEGIVFLDDGEVTGVALRRPLEEKISTAKPT